MDPVYLRPDEIEYELSIRGVHGLNTHRKRTSTLRTLLGREVSGETHAPVDSSNLFPSMAEMATCRRICGELNKLAEGVSSNKSNNFREISNRLRHVKDRLSRINPTDTMEQEQQLALVVLVEEAIRGIRKRIETGGTPAAQVTTLQQTPPPSRNLPENTATNVLAAVTDGASNANLVDISQPASKNRSPTQFPIRDSAAQQRLTSASRHESPFDISHLSREQLHQISELVDSDSNNGQDDEFRPIVTRSQTNQHPAHAVRPNNIYPYNNEASHHSIQNNVDSNGSGQLPALFPPDISYRSYTSNDIRNFGSNINIPTTSASVYNQYGRGPYQNYYEHNYGQHFVANNLGGNFGLLQPVPGSHSQPNHLQGGHFDQVHSNRNGQSNFNYGPRLHHNQDLAFNRRTVPVHKWNVRFSGDGHGLHLYDFLTQVTQLKKSERIPEPELLVSIVHLLDGRAKLWYHAIGERARSWDELVIAMRNEFLPSNYDFVLLYEIANRSQRPSETFAEYCTHMMALFKCIATPISEDHKLYLLQKNLLPKYSSLVAPLRIRTLSDLMEACRGIDDANIKSTFQLPFQWQQHQRSNQFPFARQRDISETSNVAQPPTEVDVEAMQRMQAGISRLNVHSQSDSNSSRPNNRTERAKCWNCDSEQHLNKDCRERRRIFCYSCGKAGYTTLTCPACVGNGSGTRRGVQGPSQQ